MNPYLSEACYFSRNVYNGIYYVGAPGDLVSDFRVLRRNGMGDGGNCDDFSAAALC